MEPNFTPKEILDILERELQPTSDDDYVEIFQLLGVYAYSLNKIEVGLKLRPTWDSYIAPKRYVTVKNTVIHVIVGSLFNGEQRLLLSLIGVTFVEKGRSSLIFSSSDFPVRYEPGESEDWLNIWVPHRSGRGRKEMPLKSSNTIDEMFDILARMFNPRYAEELKYKFYSELERRRLLDAHNVLSETLPEGSLVLDSLPTQTMYQILEEDRVRERRKYQ